MDSDKRTSRSPINATKRRVIEEAKEAGGLIWITDGKEIENYLSDRLVASIASGADPIEKFASVPDALGISDKIKLAETAVDATVDADLDTLDLREKVFLLCERIRQWNMHVD
jgi:hypothetical protein